MHLKRQILDLIYDRTSQRAADRTEAVHAG